MRAGYELPAEDADFRKIKGSDAVPGGQALLN
jgi:hypothetical protein